MYVLKMDIGNGFFSGGPHTAAANFLPRFNTRNISFSVFSGSGANISANLDTTASSCASAIKIFVMSAIRNPTLVNLRWLAFARATSTICSEKSSPAMKPVRPILSAICSDGKPDPLPRSTTKLPSAISALSINF